jgi:hypothetical protein
MLVLMEMLAFPSKLSVKSQKMHRFHRLSSLGTLLTVSGQHSLCIWICLL